MFEVIGDALDRLTPADPGPSISAGVYSLNLDVQGGPNDTLEDVSEKFDEKLKDIKDAEAELSGEESDNGGGMIQ